jgi:hypothetical protein
MKSEILKKSLEQDLKQWAKQIDQLPRGRRYFQNHVDSLNLPIQMDNYDCDVYDAEDYINQLTQDEQGYKWLVDYDVPVVQLVRYFNDYSQGDKRLNHYIIYPTEEYAKAYIRQQKIERIKKIAAN